MRTMKIASILLVTLLFGTSVVSNPNVLSKEKYDGETLFKGIFLGQGPVAEMFPELWTKEMRKVTNDEEAVKVADHLIKTMEEASPGYFAEFEDAIYSGNHLQVQEVFEKGGLLIDEILRTNGIEAASLEGTGEGLCAVKIAYALAAIGAAVVYSHAGAVTGATVITLYAAVVAETALWGPDSSSVDGEFTQEKVIDDVVTAFSG